MLSFRSILSNGLIITISIISASALAAPTPDLPEPSPETPNSPRQQSGSSIGASVQTAINSFMQTFRRRSRRPGLSRSGGFCPIAPGLIETDKIWSDRPLFLWQGTVEQIQLKKLGSPEVVWNQTLAPEQRSIVYSGAPLQPGQIYQWELLGEANVNASFVFQVMDVDQRTSVTARLQQIETQSKANGATSEATAIQQAQYFAEQNLWSDALQSLYSIPNPSVETARAIQQIEASLCEQANPNKP